MRIESSVTSLSWIPRQAVSGLTEIPFELGVAHFDPPPPDTLQDVEALRDADRFRFANQLRGWMEVEAGEVVGFGQEGGGVLGATTLRIRSRAITFGAVAFPELRPPPVVGTSWVRFSQTVGGRTGVPAPRRVRHPPYVQYAAPVAWTTLSLTLWADGSAAGRLEGASPFPRHWVYDHAGHLIAQSGVVDFRTWYREMYGAHTPWGDEDSPALVGAVASTCEQELSELLAATRTPWSQRTVQAGDALVRQGDPGGELFVLVDGILLVEVDGEPIVQMGPGAIVGEQALLQAGRRTATLRALTPVRVLQVPGDFVDVDRLSELSRSHGIPVARPQSPP